MSAEEEDGFHSHAAIAERARTEGMVWLNSNFHNPVERHRMNRFIRFHPLELIWGVLSGGLVALILGLGAWKIGWSGPFFFLFYPLLIVLYSVIVGWNGRKLAHLSPLRRVTGEGTATWLKIKIKDIIISIGQMLYSSAGSNNKYVTFAATEAGTPMIMDAEEYIGTARMPPGVFMMDPERELRWRQSGGRTQPELMDMVIQQTGVPVPITGNLESYIDAQKQAEAARAQAKRGKRRG